MFGCCGINCFECGAYLATQADDDAKRRQVAEQWSVEYNTTFSAEQINCDGCTSDGCHVGYAEHFCAIRKCCMGKGLATCADCVEFACAELQKFLDDVPNARANLESLRN